MQQHGSSLGWTAERVSCLCTLSQIDRRVLCAPGLLDVGLVIYQISGEKFTQLNDTRSYRSELPAHKSMLNYAGAPQGLQERGFIACSASRDVLLECYLDPGEYILLPVTAGTRPYLAVTSSTNASPLKVLS